MISTTESSKVKILHDSHLLEELSREPGVAGVAAAPGQEGHVGRTPRTVATATNDPKETGLKRKGMHHTTHTKLIHSHR